MEDCFIGNRTGNKCHLKWYSRKLMLQHTNTVFVTMIWMKQWLKKNITQNLIFF